MRVLGRLLVVLLVMAAMLFAAAGTFDYWQAWLFLAAYAASSLAITFFLMRKDPALLERRKRGGPTAEKEATQKIIMSFASRRSSSRLGIGMRRPPPGENVQYVW